MWDMLSLDIEGATVLSIFEDSEKGKPWGTGGRKAAGLNTRPCRVVGSRGTKSKDVDLFHA
jgi:hypothetical protein